MTTSIKILAFLFLLVAAACNSSESSQAASTTATTDTPQHWLTFEGNADKNKKIVLVSGDEEYRSEEALPQLAKILSTHHGFDCTVLFAQHPDSLGIVSPNYLHNIPGLESLADADLMIIQTRFRELPDEQMTYIDNFLKAGKPLIGIRTATHAFNVKDTTSKWLHYGNYYDEDDAWKGGFGRLVLGERWHTHHGHHKHQSTRGLIADGASDHPITKGIESGDIWGSTDVYGVRLPMLESVQPIIMGQVIDQTGTFDESDLFFGMHPTDDKIATVNPASKEPYDPNKPMMPIAWTKTYELPNGKQGRSFTSTIGSSSDLLNEGVRRLLVNATYHLLDMEVPEKANIAIVGNYEPTAYSFRKDDYWSKQQISITDLK